MIGFKCQLSTAYNQLSGEPQLRNCLHQVGLQVGASVGDYLGFLNGCGNTHPKCKQHFLVANQIFSKEYRRRKGIHTHTHTLLVLPLPPLS